MAVLGDTERFEVWAQIMREIPTPDVTKQNLRARVNAVDTVFDAQASNLNTAIQNQLSGAGLAAWNGFSAAQKAAILSYVLAKRYAEGA